MDLRQLKTNAGGAPPAPPAVPSVGYPSEGNPGTATPPAKPGSWWFHQIAEELRNVIVAASLTPDHLTLNQLLSAIPLVVPVATETVQGKIELATAAEAQAWTDAVRAITPLQLAAAFKGANQSLGSGTGYQRFPGGLILQWGGTGSIAPGASAVITFPIAFPVAGDRVIGSSATNANVIFASPTITTTNFTVWNYGSATGGFSWLAIGR